jgi:hypothetical protein
VAFSSAVELAALMTKANLSFFIPALSKLLNSLIAGFKSSKLGLTG